MLILLDPHSRVYAGEENDNGEATAFSTLLERLATETGASVLVSAHMTKGAAKGPGGKFDLGAALHMDAFRGASAFSAAGKWQRDLVSLPGDIAKGQGLADHEHTRYIAGRVCKVNEAPEGVPFFMRRAPDGTLRYTEPEKTREQSQAEAEILEWILGKVRDHAAQGKEPLTVRDLGRFSAEWKEIPKASRQRVEDVARVAVLDEKLFTVIRENKSGRKTEYLSLTPEVPEASGDAPSFEPPEAPSLSSDRRGSGMTILDHPSLAGLKHVSSTDGGEWCGVCPKCGGRDRFHVWPNKGASGKFWCRGCGWSGDGIQFLRDLEGLSYPEACRRIGTAPRTGRRPMAPQQKATWAPKPSLLPCPVWQTTAAAFVEYAAGVMAMDAEGQAYALGRGLTPETIRACRIGWNPRTCRNTRASWGLPPEPNVETGKAKTVWLPRGLVIPSIRAGTVTALKVGRTDWRDGDPVPKYSWTVGGCMRPMVLAAAPGKPAVIVEGELDALLIHQSAGDLVTAKAKAAENGRKPKRKKQTP